MECKQTLGRGLNCALFLVVSHSFEALEKGITSTNFYIYLLLYSYLYFLFYIFCQLNHLNKFNCTFLHTMYDVFHMLLLSTYKTSQKEATKTTNCCKVKLSGQPSWDGLSTPSTCTLSFPANTCNHFLPYLIPMQVCKSTPAWGNGNKSLVHESHPPR
jgi:hypothetical protein